MVRTELRKIIGKDVFCVAKSDDDTYAVVSVPWRHIRRKTQNHRPCKTGRKKPFPRGAAGAGQQSRFSVCCRQRSRRNQRKGIDRSEIR